MGAQAKLKSNPQDELKSLLQSCYLFQEATEDILDFAIQSSETVVFNKGDCIILENEANNFVYFIAQGAVEIVSYLASENRIQRLSLLKSGSHFAEFSVLTKSNRSGSAYAFEDCTLVRMEGASFIALLKAFPALTLRLIQLLADLNVRTETSSDIVPFYQPSQLKLSQEVLHYVPMAICQKMGVIPSSIQNNLLSLIMKNPQNREFLETLRRSFPKVDLAVHLISEREFEPAFQSAQKSVKNPLTTSHSVSTSAAPKDVDMHQALKKSTLFGDIREEILQQILTHVTPLPVEAGTCVLQPGSELENYYLIASGRVQIQHPLSHGQALAPLMSLTAGEGFGEVQLITGSTSQSFVRALEDSVLLPIPKSILQQLLKLPTFCLALAKVLALKLQVLGHITGLRYYKFEGRLDFKDVADLLPESLLEQQKVLPLQISDKELALGLVNPDSSEILSSVSRYLLNYRLKLYGITEDQFKTNLAQLKAQAHSKIALAPMFANPQSQAKLDVIKWIDQLLLLGFNNRSSDIHFEPSETHLTVRFRIDGVLQEHSEKLPAETAKEITSRLKILSEMDIGQQHIPQDGQLKTQIGNLQIMARASAIPVRCGEKIVLRLIRSQSSVVPMDMLAPDRRVLSLLRMISRCRQGLFLVTGPTGSGKTTTLYSMLNAINDIGVNVTTIEDPVEMEITGFNQIEVDRKRGVDFATALRSVLRQDPNVIMVGEIRDQESAKIAFDASITGHLVLSTLHTNSSLDIAPRLLELGVTPASLAAGLLGVLSQRLLRANCKKCLTTRPILDSEKVFIREHLKSDQLPDHLHYSTGCPACDQTGFHHRIPVFEIWRNTPAMRRGLLAGAGTEELMKIAREDGFETLLEAGLRLALSGLTSLEEVRRVLSGI